MTIIQKPTFRETIAVTTIDLPEYNIQFKLPRVGPTGFIGLRNANYGLGFKMPTMSQLIPLVYASLEHRNKETAQNVVKALRNNWLVGDTGILYTRRGMFVQDNPQMEKRLEGVITIGDLLMDEKSLKDMLGSREEKGVVFSDDGKIRFARHGFEKEFQTASALAKNRGVIALSGSVENAEMLALSSKHYPEIPLFTTLKKVKEPTIRGVNISSLFGDRLSISANYAGHIGLGFSYGVRELKSGAD